MMIKLKLLVAFRFSEVSVVADEAVAEVEAEEVVEVELDLVQEALLFLKMLRPLLPNAFGAEGVE